MWYGGAEHMADTLSSITVVLCRPQEAGNVGSVCRAMKTMGITSLRIVEPAPTDMHQARVRAVHAVDVLDSSTRFSSVADAVRGCSLVAGVTRREGRWRKQLRLTPEELANRLAEHPGTPAAVVFGNEESGLSDHELEPCHLAVSIPSSPLFPSLNLSHAVQIVTYAMFKRLGNLEATRFAPAGAERVRGVADALMASLRESGYFSQGFEAEMRLLYEDILARAALSEAEAVRVERCFDIQRELIARLRKLDASETSPGD